ncbi:gliding motility-associated C-terminal domain-containing protein [Flavobacterium sp. GSB-24]|uniref:Ig-like domain-containing protein n=1 Tax=Flavobacterium sp. GSB-24 TaxID=2994319 RepID=UPI002490B966|nr:gliding motility-associated C-terminal domain-containing protein [Flavobacterium sp. GSB-24]BDU24747.1 protein of unknown function precursor; adhesin [Flavobacterium sp. GSB-24]
MRNFTFNLSRFSRHIFLIVFLLICTYNASAQFYTKHYIAPAPWQYFSKANEIVIATNSTTPVTIEILKSDGTLITNSLTASKGSPAVYRFAGLPKDAPALKLNTVINAAGLIVTGSKPISINLRNIASDALGGEGSDKDIKGNAALTSFGDAGIGIRYRIGYYRDGSLGNFGGYGDQRPIYSIMAITNGTSVKFNSTLITLNAGQSYLFTAPIGTLVESSNPTVMNTSAAIDTPDGCGDGAYNQIPPEAVLGTEYFIQRGKGNDTAEQTTVVATKANTKVTVDTFSATGVLTGTIEKTLLNAGDFFTFGNGISKTNFSASRVFATNTVAVYSGTARDCEVDVYTIAPVSQCGGSNFIETAKFRNYGVGSLPYFGYVLLKDASSKVYVNGQDIETKSGISARRQLGNTGWYLINFEDTQIGSPDVLSLSSDAKLTVSIVQQGGGFTMAGFFSNFAVQPEDPTFNYISGGGCTNNSALLKTQTGLSPYQWYLNGVAIAGANSDTYTATKTGSYSVASTLTCGAQTQSKPVSVTLCTDLGIAKTVDNATPCVGSNVEFTVKLSNLGGNNSTGVSVNDLLPTGYTFVSSTQTTGNYNATTGVWSIGDVNGGATETLKIIAKVNASGVYTNTASLPSTTTDSNAANNSASVSTTPNPLPTLTINNPASVCSPSTVDLTSSTVTAGSSSNLTFTYWTNSAATAAYATPTAATAGTYYIKATNSFGCSVIKSVVVTVATPPNSGVLSGVQNICTAGTSNFTSNGNTGGVWTSNNTSIATVNSSTGLVTGVSSGTATITYKVTGTGGCSDAVSTRTITVTTAPNAGTLSGTQNICIGGTSTFSSSGDTGGAWTSDNTSIATVNSSTGLVTGVSSGTATITYKVTGTGGCSDVTSTRTITVSPTPIAPTASAQSFCSADNKTVNDLTVTNGSNLKWYTQLTGGSALASTDILTTRTYYVSQTSASGCESSRTSVDVTINPTPVAPTASVQSFCSADNKTVNDLTVTTGSNLKWYTQLTGGNALASTDILTTRTYYVSQTSASGCESSRTSVDVTINPTPAAPTASAQLFCSADNKTINDLIVTTGSNLKWYTQLTGGSSLASTDILTTRTYYVSQATNTCESARTAVSVIVTATPSTPILSSITQPTCSTFTGSFTINNYDSTYNYIITPSTGVINNAGTITAPTGSYTISASINGCSSGNVSFAINSILCANADSFGTKTSGLSAVNIGNVKTNDTLNGLAVTAANTSVTPKTDGVLSVDADGEVTLSADAPSGSYSITYEICEKNTANCKTAAATVDVVNGLVANADSFGTKTSGSSAVNIGNVKTNDTLNGLAVTAANTSVTPKTDGVLSVDADGEVTLSADTPSGSYSITYEICEKNTANCKTAAATVVVDNKIKAVVDTITPINGNIGGTTVVLTANDTLNGNPVVIGTNPGEVSINIVGTLPTGLTLNSNGTITVSPSTPKGDYNVEYVICEVGAVPANCDSVTIVVPVTSGDLVANPDTVSSVVGSNTNQTVNVNVLDNDTKNGQKLDPSDVNLTVSKPDPKGYLVLNPDGTLTLGANAPAGDYELEYTICEKLNPSNCKSNTVTVTATAPKIEAVADPVTSINGNIGGTTISLTANDKLNGNPAVVGTASGEVSFEIIGTLPSGFTLNPDHTITVAPNTPAGNYNVEYRICENTNPTNCDSVISVVTVTSGDLVANPDTVPSVIGSNTNQTLNVNVLDNDTKNGQKLDPSDVNLTVSKPDPKGYLILNPDGTLSLGANAPAGNYELEYTICEKLNPSNCKSNTVTVTVTAPKIEAVADPVTSINGNIGGTTISLTANDKLNGNPAVVGTALGEVSFEIIGTLPSGFTLNPDHTITVAPNTPAGNYNVEYRICENTNPTNCDSVISVVTVTSGDLVANPDTVPSVIGSNTNQTLNVNVLDNDTKNGQKLDPSDVNLTVSKPDPKGYLILNPDGTLSLGANAPAGNYELEYTICEKLNPSNCKSNTVTVTVTAPKIEAVADPVTSINGNIGGTTISLTANDKLNGNPAVVGTALGEVSFEIIGTLPSGFTLNPDHTITVAPNTPAGNYNVEYRICENTNPTNCDSVISVVTVTGGDLVANEDLVPSAVGVNVSQTLINVFTNDTKNGNALIPSDVNLTPGTDPKGYLTIDANGNVILAPNAPAGDYELPYTICEKLNPSNCSSNVVKVTVTEPKMTVSANSYCSNNVPYVNYTVTPDNFTTANLLTVKWIDSANNVVATQTNLPLSGNIIWPGAIVDGSGNGVDWPGWILNNGQWTEGADGFELTRNGVKLEFSLNPTVTVSVAYPAATSGCNARPTFSIKANNDEAGPIDVKKGMNASLNIFANDFVNGVNPNPSDVILSTVVANPNLTLNTDGSINITANTPNGVYELTYQICEAANTSNCSQATIKITVLNTLDPASPASNEITLGNDNNISVDGINGSLEFVNVLDNDLINGQPINPADVVVKPLTTNAYFEWNADGTVNVKPNTPGGNYPLTYQVCEKADPLNCSTAVMNVFVEVPAIAVIKTAVFNDEDKSGYANAGETITYKFTVTNTGNVPLIGITITDPLTGVVVSGQPIDLNVNESNETNFTAVYKITQEDINLGSVSNQAIAQGKSSRGVVVEDKSDDSSNNGDNPTVLDLNGCAIKVFKAFSPNGDEKNARFFIRGIECYPDNTVEIYNRWGVLVFSIDQYNNTDRVFLGYSNGRSTIKQTDGLPVGTYFYILKYKDSAKNPHEESGYLYINK